MKFGYLLEKFKVIREAFKKKKIKSVDFFHPSRTPPPPPPKVWKHILRPCLFFTKKCGFGVEGFPK